MKRIGTISAQEKTEQRAIAQRILDAAGDPQYAARIADALVKMPELAAGVKNLDELFSKLVQSGQRSNLEVLLSSRRLPRYAAKVLASVLLGF